MAGLKIEFSNFLFDTVPQPPAFNGSKMGPKSTYWGISQVFSVTILLKKILVPPQVIANLFYFLCKFFYY
jgi:hypothetical protein